VNKYEEHKRHQIRMKQNVSVYFLQEQIDNMCLKISNFPGKSQISWTSVQIKRTVIDGIDR